MSSKSLGKALPWIIGGSVLIILVIALGAVWLFATGCHAIPGLLSCAVVRLPESSLSADFYDGEQLLSAGSNAITVPITPGQIRHINVRKITDNGYDPSTDFIYDDTMIDVTIPAGQFRTFVVSPSKDYLKGQLRLTCDIKAAEIGDDVSCHPEIDGAPVADIPGGHSTTYALETGSHTVHVELVGSKADVWFPESQDDDLDISAGQVFALTESFNRMTQLTVNVDQSGVVGDLFLDGKLIGDQVASAQVYVRPNENYTVVGSNFDDPAAKGTYRWNTVGFGVKVGAETKKVVSLPMDKEDLTGVVTIACHLAGYKSSDAVECEIPVDGGEPVSKVAPEKSIDVRVKPGVHTLTVRLTGADAARWVAPSPQRVTVKTGQTTSVSFSGVRLAQATPTIPPAPTVPPKIGIPTLPPPPGSTAVPTLTPRPRSIYTATLSYFGANARSIFQRGKALGHDPKKFSKVGDCETDSPYFLIPFDAGIYNLGQYRFLDPMVKNFAGSFSRSSIAGKGSFVASSVLDSQWSDPSLCGTGETPLACEYRVNNPAVALIMLRTYPYPWEPGDRQKYIDDMRAVIDYTISQGIVPVVSTIPLIEASPNELYDMNNIIRQIAAEYNIPLWDFYATLSTLPNSGVKNSHLTVPEDGGTTFNGDDMNYGMTHRNLETLEVLHNLYSNVLR